MAAVRRFFSRILNLLRPGRAEAELSRELDAHLGLLEEGFRTQGLPPDEAHREARLALGGLEQTKERQRDTRSFTWLEDARRDARYAVRLLRYNPIMTVTAALSLAVGIGANTAIFTVANGLLFRDPVGVAAPDRLVQIGTGRPDGGFNPTSYLNFLDVRQRATTLDGVYAQPMFPHAMSLGVAGNPANERVFALNVSLSYFSVLGAVPAAGRLFGAADSEQPRASPIVVLSHRYWTRRFNADPSIVGQAIRLNGQPFTVVGVTAEGFQGTGIFPADVWWPMTMAGVMNPRGEAPLASRDGGWLIMGARLKPGVTVDAAAAEVEAISQALQREYSMNRPLRLACLSAVGGDRGTVTTFFTLLMAIVSLVLLVACSNVSGILLARAAARRREMAVRLAIGAGRGRLVRQLLMETFTLFVLSGLAGLALARAMTTLLVASMPASSALPFPVSMSLALDWRVLAVTAGLSLAAALLSGLAPALQASNADPMHAMKDEGQGPSSRSRLRHAFVIAQVAFSLLMVVVAGLFVRALVRAGAVDPGFDPRGVELATVDLGDAGYTEATLPAAGRELIARVRRLPNVESAALARVLPGGFETIGIGGFSAPGLRSDWSQFFEPAWNIVEPGYFDTLRIPIVTGRDFTADDRAGTQPVIILGEAAARYFWSGRNAVGQYMTQEIDAPGGRGKMTRSVLVVGVARDVKSSSLIDGMAPSFIYLPLQQQAIPGMISPMTIVARTANGRRLGDELRTVVTTFNPNLALDSSGTLEDAVALGLIPQRLMASIASTLGLVGLLLAGIGIYGVTAFSVTRRLREFGVRIALGARRADIIRIVLWQGLSLTAIGGVIGLSLAALIGVPLASFLFDLPALDPVTFIGAAILFAVIGLTACYGPARRATQADPLAALRQE